MGFLLFPIYGLLMGLRLAALRAAGAQRLKDRRTIDVIITKFFPLCFKMECRRFENLDNLLRDWEKHKISKSLVETKNRYGKREEEKNRFLFRNDSEKILEQSQSAVERDYEQNTKLVSKLTLR